MKRSIKTVIALGLVAAMTIGGSVVAFADVNMDDATDTVRAGEGETVNVKNDVTVDGPDYGVVASEGGVINVGGDVKNETEGRGEAVSTNNGGTVVVEGSASAAAYGALAEEWDQGKGGGSITIKGDVEGSIGAFNGEVTVGGNVTGTSNNDYNDNAAIGATGDSVVSIKGNVTSNGTGVFSGAGNPLVVIEGTLTAKDSSPVIMVDHSDYGPDGLMDSGDTGSVTLVVYEIKGNTDNLVKAGHRTGGAYVNGEQVPEGFEEDEASKERQLNNIFYIIKQAEGSSEGISSLSGTEKKAGFDTAKANTVITVNVKEGYGLKAGSIQVTKNADGSYTLTVPVGGGVTLSTEQLQKAVEEIEKKEDEGKKDDVANSDNTSSSSKKDETPAATQPAAAPATVAAPTTNGTVTVTGTTASGAANASDPQFSAQVVNMISSVPAGGELKLEVTGSGAFLNEAMVDALIARSDVSVSLNFSYLGTPYSIRIPAGYNLKALKARLAKNGGILDLATLIDIFGVDVVQPTANV